MARAPFTVTVVDAAGNAKSGATVTARRRSDAAVTTVYSAETGSGTVANPVSTDAAGRAAGWLERGAYRLDVAGTGITAYSVNFDASPAADGAVDAAWLASAALPIGGLMPYAGASDPAGGYWVIADGRALSRTTYAAAFAIMGTTHGAGDGSTTFNIPNPRGRAVIGAGAGSGLTSRALGTSGGVETVALAESEMPIHAHDKGSLAVDAHSHPLNPSGAEVMRFTGIQGEVVRGVGNLDGSHPQGVAQAAATQNATPGISGATASKGSGNAHTNMPPWLALNYIVRVL